MKRILLRVSGRLARPSPARAFLKRHALAQRAAVRTGCRAFSSEAVNLPNTMIPHSEKTVFALSTPWGISGVSVIRISGPAAKQTFAKMTRPETPPEPRVATLRTFVDPKNPNDVIDRGVAIFFPGPHSYTGEDVVELQVHGSIAVIRDILSALQSLPGFAAAEPGDFTKRAWLNSKFRDLTMLEAVADLLRAETSAQRKQAQSQLRGDLGDLYHRWTVELHTCLAHLEALVDFGDDEHLSQDIPLKVTPKVKKLLAEIKAHLGDAQRGELLRNGLTVCLAGRPNAGKSSLLNMLSKRDVSIVSPEAGTTRDVVEVRLDLAGFPLILQDTAGVREGPDLGFVEKEGILRAVSNFKTANVKLVLFDLSSLIITKASSLCNRYATEIDQDDRTLIALLREHPENTIIVLNKSDIAQSQCQSQGQPLLLDESKLDEIFGREIPRLTISAKTGTGVPELLDTLERTVKRFFETGSFEGPVMTRQRYRQNLLDCVEALERYLETQDVVELAAEELRLAGRCIQRITGRVDVEQILDIVFRDFCIGK